MFALLRNTFRLATVVRESPVRSLCLYRTITPQTANSMGPLTNNMLLVPTFTTVTPARGMKQVGFVRRRCKDCLFVRREDRLYNICKTHPRHNQMQQKKSEKNSWILTHATQGKVRPW